MPDKIQRAVINFRALCGNRDAIKKQLKFKQNELENRLENKLSPCYQKYFREISKTESLKELSEMKAKIKLEFVARTALSEYGEGLDDKVSFIARLDQAQSLKELVAIKNEVVERVRPAAVELRLREAGIKKARREDDIIFIDSSIRRRGKIRLRWSGEAKAVAARNAELRSKYGV